MLTRDLEELGGQDQGRWKYHITPMSKLCSLHLQFFLRESSGSVVEYLTRDGGAAGSSLTDVTALCP